jgi:amidophosphoribosyltransferase
VALAHNGNLTNFLALREQLVSEGAIFQSTSDSEVILHLIARSRKAKFTERFIDALSQIEGGYALVALTNKKLIGVRDPLGIRPLVLGDLDGKSVLASETCALDMVGARFVRDIEHGEMVVIDQGGIQSLRPFPARQARPCIFEYVYFARPDSVVNGKSVYEVRKRMGRRLAMETPADVDVVVPVPDSGVPAALGFAQEAGVPFEMGIIRNHYVGRTFIQPTQGQREMGVRMKLSPNRAVLAGKRVMLIDDSIVRGTNSVRVVRMVREAGAAEVHLRSASPPIQWPDYYGIDMPDREKLLAANHSVDEIARILNVDSMGYLSVDGLYWAMEAGPRDAAVPQFTDHYFTGEYPTRLLDREIAQGRNEAVERQLSFLVDA